MTQLLTGPEAIAAMKEGKIVHSGYARYFKIQSGYLYSAEAINDTWHPFGSSPINLCHPLFSEKPTFSVVTPEPSRLERAIEDYVTTGNEPEPWKRQLREFAAALKAEILEEVKG